MQSTQTKSIGWNQLRTVDDVALSEDALASNFLTLDEVAVRWIQDLVQFGQRLNAAGQRTFKVAALQQLVASVEGLLRVL